MTLELDVTDSPAAVSKPDTSAKRYGRTAVAASLAAVAVGAVIAKHKDIWASLERLWNSITNRVEYVSDTTGTVDGSLARLAMFVESADENDWNHSKQHILHEIATCRKKLNKAIEQVDKVTPRLQKVHEALDSVRKSE